MLRTGTFIVATFTAAAIGGCCRCSTRPVTLDVCHSGATAVVRGAIRDAVTGDPVPAHVEVRGAAYATEADSTSGEFEIFGVTPGRYTLRALRIGYRPFSQEIRAQAGYCTTLLIRLRWAASVQTPAVY